MAISMVEEGASVAYVVVSTSEQVVTDKPFVGEDWTGLDWIHSAAVRDLIVAFICVKHTKYSIQQYRGIP